MKKIRTSSAADRAISAASGSRFHDYWQRRRSKGHQIEIFDSREPIGIGHTKLWKALTTERRHWRRCLKQNYGYNVCSGQFTTSPRFGTSAQSIPVLEKDTDEQAGADVFGRWSRRRQCLRHPFYIALEQYLVACECLERCGDPSGLLAKPGFIRYPERLPYLFLNGKMEIKSFLLDDMRPSDIIPGETKGEYEDRPHKQFRCRDISGAFDALYKPVVDILLPEVEEVDDAGQFYGAFADSGISLRSAKRLKAALRDGDMNPYERKRDILPAVVMNKVLPALWKIADLTEREAAFNKLPGKAAYQLELVLGAERKPKRKPELEMQESREHINRALEDRVSREQLVEQGSRGVKIAMSTLTGRQRDVYMLNRVDNLTLKEISQRLNISPGTAASHLSRARVKIKEQTKTKS